MMNLDEKLHETVSQPDHGKGRGRVFLLRHFDAIRQARAQGYTHKDIWQTLHDANLMPITYRHFNRLLAKHLPAEVPPPAPTAAPPTAPPQAPTSRAKPREAPPPARSLYNPVPDPSKLF